MAVKDNVFRALTQLIVHRKKLSSGYGSTVATAAAAGATSIQVVANPSPNLVNGSTIRINGELNRVSGTITGAGPYTLPLAWPLTFAHPIGDAVDLMVSYDMGDIEGAGATVRVQGESQDVQVSTKRLAYTVLNGYQDLGAEFAFPNVAVPNWPIMLGMLSTVVSGALTTADPIHFATDGNEFGGESGLAFTFVGVLVNGTVAYFEVWNCDADYAGAELTLKLGELASLPVKVFGEAGVAGQGATGYTLDTTLKPTKGKVIQSITEVGIFEVAGGGASTTIATATAAAGQKVAELASGTGVAGGDVLKFNTQGLAEYHEAQSYSNPNVTLRTKLLRDMAVGTTVVEYARTVFGGVSEDGFTFSVGGETRPIRVATSRTSLGRLPGTAVMTAKFNVIEITPSFTARALAIAQSAIASNRLPITGALLGQSPIDGAYVKGLYEDGTTFEMRFWGCTQSITDFALTLNNSGALPSVPIEIRPTSGVQVLNSP